MRDFIEIHRLSSEEDANVFEILSKITHQESLSTSEPFEISDSVSVPHWKTADVTIDSSAFSTADLPFELLYFFPDNQSTQIRTTPEGLVALKEIQECRKRFADTLLQLIHEEIFEFGMENAADSFVQENLRDNPVFTKEWLNQILLEHFADVEVATGILRIVSHLKYAEIYPTGPTMALSVLSHENAEIRECGIRAFENWGNTDSLEYLKHIKCEEEWLQDYLEQVISYLEECHAFFGQKS